METDVGNSSGRQETILGNKNGKHTLDTLVGNQEAGMEQKNVKQRWETRRGTRMGNENTGSTMGTTNGKRVWGPRMGNNSWKQSWRTVMGNNTRKQEWGTKSKNGKQK